MTILLQGAGLQTAAAAPVPPLFVSAEVGTVNASTVAVTFDQDVSASDYSAGVTIKVNGSGATISSATRQANHAIVYYVISAAVVNGDTVTWEYVEASGNIVAEDDSTPLEDVTAQSVTNNVHISDPIGDTLRADAVAYWIMDETSGTRIDATGRGNNLTQHGGVGLANGGADFDGSTKYLSMNSTADLSIDDSVVALFGWVRPEALGLTGSTVIWQKADQNSGEYFIQLAVTPTVNDAYLFSIPDGEWNYPVVQAGDNVLNVWHFILCEHNVISGKIRISVDNGTYTELAAAAGQPSDNSIVSFGSNQGIDLFFDGQLKWFGKVNRLLSTDERDYLWNSGAGRALFPAP